MAIQRYSVAPHAIETLPAWVKSGEMTIPEIQRPSVRDATKGPQSSGFPLSGVSGGLPAGHLAQSAGATQGRLQVVMQTYRHRRPAAAYRADGRLPRAKVRGLPRSRYNRIASFVLAQSEIDIAIGGNPPERYFAELAEQCNGGAKKYGGITDMAQMRNNLRRSCVPGSLLGAEVPDYDEFLEQRRVLLLARKFQTYFGGL